MRPISAESIARHSTNRSIDVFMQLRKLSVPNGPLSQLSVTELELTASHTLDPNHLNPSCPDCRQLRAQLRSIARSALEHIGAMQTEIDFKTYTDPGIVCSPADGQRPSATVSIYIWDRPGASTPHGASFAISHVQRALVALGVRSR